MKREPILVILGLVTGLATGCRTPSLNTVTQISTLDALERGEHTGLAASTALRAYGDFGYGICERLDGQVILLDGTVHRVGGDGRLKRTPVSGRVSYAAVSRFRWDQAVTISERTDLQRLETVLTQAAVRKSALCALRIRGRFLGIGVFSLAKTDAPTARYTDVAAKRPIMEHQDISGTVLGYRFPAYMKGVALPGFRLFFVSDNLEFGGEVVDFTLQHGTVEIDTCTRLNVLLAPATP